MQDIDMVATSERIREAFLEGSSSEHSHMIVVCDTFDYEDFFVYVKRTEDIESIERKYNNPANMTRVMEIYNYDMNLEFQLKERRAMHKYAISIGNYSTEMGEYNSQLIDLHTHSCYSDGELTPNELLKLAIKRGIGTIAVTDHDTLLGNENIFNENGLKNIEGITVIPGIELTAQSNVGGMHILGYGINIGNLNLIHQMEKQQKNSIESVLLMVHQLQRQFGIVFPKEKVEAIIKAQRNIGRIDLAKLMLEECMVGSVKEAFDKYLVSSYQEIKGNLHKPRYEECIEWITRAGGIPVLAHPNLLKLTDKELLKLIKEMISSGLQGVEVYHSGFSKEESEQYVKIALENNLLMSGGTDYHGGVYKPNVELGTGIQKNIRIHQLTLLDKLKR